MPLWLPFSNATTFSPRSPDVSPGQALVERGGLESGCMEEFLRRVLAFQSNGPDSPWHASSPIPPHLALRADVSGPKVELGARLDFEGPARTICAPLADCCTPL
jgi:hypothetical protein